MTYIDPNTSLKELIEYQRSVYSKLVPVTCYSLRKEVKFTAQGFEHLHTDGRKHRRGNKDARSRLFLMEHAPSVITQSRFVKTDAKKPEETRSGKREIYHELYGKVGVRQVNVVVTLRVIGDGDLHFYGIRYHKKKATTK